MDLVAESGSVIRERRCVVTNNVQVQLEAEFPWGVLLLTDSTSREVIPSWTSHEATVAVAETALVMRVLHGDEGCVDVRVVRSVSAVRGGPVFDGWIEVESGALRLSDALGDQAVELQLVPGRHRVRLFSDDPLEGTQVDVVLDDPVQ